MWQFDKFNPSSEFENHLPFSLITSLHEWIPRNSSNPTKSGRLLASAGKTIISLKGSTPARQNHCGIKIKLQNLNLGFNNG
jgi:hypothetical protein